MAERKYPIGIQTFERIRDEGYAYVDKTGHVYRLTHGNSVYHFLSRPRRFGKSLLISTLDAYFSGRRELFEGLSISKLEQEVEKYKEEAKYEEQEKDGKKEKVEISPEREMAKIVKREVPINDPNPLWAKHPSDCS